MEEDDGLNFIPRICDFGLAKLVDEVSHETSSGLAIGSAPYMAPEQAAGRTRDQGPATDLYALGVILYELLTGRPPFRGETDLETLRLVSDQDPPSPRALRPGLPRDLETICLKCLEKRPARRYAGARTLRRTSGDSLTGVRSGPGGRPLVSAWESGRGDGRFMRRWRACSGSACWREPAGWNGHRLRERQNNDALREAVVRSLRSQAEERKQRELVARHQIANRLRVAGWHVERGEDGPARSIVEALAQGPVVPNSRGFAWSYLYKIYHPRVSMLPAVPETVWSVACSSDGRTVALADRTRNIFLVDRVTGRLRALRGNPRHFGNPVMVFSPDGRCLVSRVGGITPPELYKIVVNLWDVASGEEVRGMPVAFGVCHSVLFSPDGQTLITVESTATSREAPVRSWRFSDDRKCVVLGESLRPDQLANRLAPARRSANPGSRPFQLTDVLAVTPDA